MDRTRRQMLEYLARDVETKDLDRIISAMPYLISEAVRELNGEVEYIQAAPLTKRRPL